MSRRSFISSTAVFSAIAAASCITIAATTGLASVRDTPGIAAVPPGTAAYLDAPEARVDNKPETIERPGPSTLTCHRWPDGSLTQTFDANSPACVAEWDAAAGNGGSTSRGVDENVIRVAIPQSSPEIEQLVGWFNANYQMYGRSISLVEVGSLGNAAQQRAAISATAEAGVFAFADVDSTNAAPADTDALLTELAKRDIIGAVSAGVKKDATLTGSGPYAWSYDKTDENKLRMIGQFVCNSLSQHPARHDGEVTDTARSFAIVAPSGVEVPQMKRDTTPLSEELEKCGVSAPVYEYQDSGFSQDPALSSRDQAMYKRMLDEGVTSVLFVGDTAELNGTQITSARAAGFIPEWIVGRGHIWGGWESVPEDVGGNVIALYTDVEVIEYTQWPAYRAMIAAGVRENREWSTKAYSDWYNTLSIIAAGIQGAGPNLTPESFAAGLESTDFPSPGAGQRPMNPPTTGFQLGSHMFRQDVVVARLDTTKRSGPLSYGWCIGDDGKRFGFAHPFPDTDEKFFDPNSCQ